MRTSTSHASLAAHGPYLADLGRAQGVGPIATAEQMLRTLCASRAPRQGQAESSWNPTPGSPGSSHCPSSTNPSVSCPRSSCSVSASWKPCGSRNKSPQTEWLKTSRIYSLSVLEARSPKSRCRQAGLSLKALGKSPFSSPLAPGGRGRSQFVAASL